MTINFFLGPFPHWQVPKEKTESCKEDTNDVKFLLHRRFALDVDDDGPREFFHHPVPDTHSLSLCEGGHKNKKEKLFNPVSVSQLLFFFSPLSLPAHAARLSNIFIFFLSFLFSIVYFIKINSSQLDGEADKGLSQEFSLFFKFCFYYYYYYYRCGLIEIWE